MKKSTILIGVLVFLAALALRVGLTAMTVGLSSPPDAEANPDQLDYERYAHHLSEGRGYVENDGKPSATRAPGTSFFLAPAYWLCGHSFAAGRIWFAIVSSLTCVSTLILGSQLADRRVGVIAAIWLAFYPGHFYWALHFLSEAPFAFCLAGASVATIAALRRGLTALDFLAGLAWGAGVLVRPQLVFALPPALLVALWLIRRNRGYSRQILLQAMAAACLISVWVARNEVVFGHASITSVGGPTFWGAHNDIVLEDPEMSGRWVRSELLTDAAHPLQGGEFEIEAMAWKYGLDWISAHWLDMPWLVLMKLDRLLTPFPDTTNQMVYYAFAVSWAVTAPFLIVGLVVLFQQDRLVGTVLAVPLAGNLLNTSRFLSTVRQTARIP